MITLWAKNSLQRFFTLETLPPEGKNFQSSEQEVILHQKWILPFSHKLNAEYFYTQQFLRKKSIFRENDKNPFLVAKSLLKGRGHLAKKINITFLCEMRFLIFFYLIIFSKEVTFPRKWQKNFGWTWAIFIFKRKGPLISKINRTCFITN